MSDISWSKELKQALKDEEDEIVKICAQEVNRWGETKDKPRYCDIDDPLFLKVFDSGYGGTEGCHFTVWGKKNIYFPVCYDGSEWVGAVRRNPCLEASEHHGGG